MPKYRTLEPVAFIQDGSVVSVKADRVIELAEDQAKSLAGKVLNVENKTNSMFPDGAPIIDQHFARSIPNMRVAGEHVEADAPAPKPARVEAPKAETAKPQQPKPESK